jgi:hypothetical protein
MPGTTLAARWWRLLFLGRNPLVRRWDRLERNVVVAAVLLVLVAAPFAGMLGSNTYARESERARFETTTRHEVTATLLVDAPPASAGGRSATVGGTALVKATWTRSDGTRVTGDVLTAKGGIAGDKVTVWLDTRENPVSAPLREDVALWNAIGTALLSWLGFITFCGAGFWLAHLSVNRARYAEWEREWDRQPNGRR